MEYSEGTEVCSQEAVWKQNQRKIFQMEKRNSGRDNGRARCIAASASSGPRIKDSSRSIISSLRVTCGWSMPSVFQVRGHSRSLRVNWELWSGVACRIPTHLVISQLLLPRKQSLKQGIYMLLLYEGVQSQGQTGEAGKEAESNTRIRH